MDVTDKQSVGLLAIVVALCIGILVLDILLPLGVASGVPYVAVVLLTMRSSNSRHTVIAAVGCSVLTVLGFFLSASGMALWMVLVNRGLALFAIWVAAVMALRYKFPEQKLRVIVDEAPTGMIVVNRDGMIQMVNSMIEQLFGYARDELLGQPVEKLLPNRFRSGHPELRKAFFDRPEARAMGEGRNLFALRKDGSEFPIEIGLNPIRRGTDIFVLATLVDITKRNRTEDQILQHTKALSESRQAALSIAEDAELARRVAERANAELQRINKELDDFAYIASHDLKAPLRAIKNLSQWITEDVGDELPDKSGEHLEKLRQRVERMEGLLDDILEYSRAGRMMGDMHEVDTGALVRDVVELFAPSNGFSVCVADEMPTLTTYKTPLSQVFRNLIGNAIKHHDREDGRVNVECRRDGRFIEFTVSDDGPGIDEKFYERIFRMFHTLRPRDDVEGSGVGLAIVKKVVESQGGTVSVESGGNRGTTFRFTWPKSEKK